MKNFDSEKIAIILEIISFFLVTTDLLGKKRLENLEIYLSHSSENIDSEITERVGRFIVILSYIYTGIIFFISLYYQKSYKLLRLNEYFDNANSNYIIDAIFVGLLIGGSILIFKWLSELYGWIGKAIMYLLIGLRFVLILLIKQLLKITSIEGLLLTVGTITFLVSKYISFLNIK